MHTAPRTTPERPVTRLQEIELFEGLPASELDDLAHALEHSSARPGQFLEVQDAPVRRWRVIVSGHALVARDGTPLGLLSRGESWSEHSILNRQRSPISVVAFSPLSVLSVASGQFTDLLARCATLRSRVVDRSASSADRLALPVYRALVCMTERERRPTAEPILFPS